MATFKSYASQGSFTPIKAPDVASLVEQKAKDQSNYMRESADYNLKERQRIGNTIEVNNELEFRNRQQLFDFETKNLQAIQNQVMGNYQATLSNIQAQNKSEIATLNAISNISQTAFKTVQDINEKVETGRKLAVEQTLYATGITTKELMEIHKLDRNLSDQAYAENSAIRAIVDRTGASIQQIRYLHQNSNAKMWNESNALIGNTVSGFRTHVNDRYGAKYDLGDGRQLSLAETEGRDPGAYDQIFRLVHSEYAATSGMLNLSTSILGAKVHPQMRAIENEYKQQSNAKYRGFVKADAEQQVFFTLDQNIRNGGADYIASQLEARSGAARSAFLADVYKVVAANAEGPQSTFYEELWKNLLARPTVYNGKETTYSEVLKSPAAQEVTQAFFNARQRVLARSRQQEAFEERNRDAYEDYAVDVLSQKPGGFTAADVDAAIQEFGVRFPGQTSQRLEVMKNNQSVDALEIQRQVKEAEDLQNRGILTMEYMRDMGYHSSVISRFQQAAKAASDSRKANDNYKYELASLSALAKKPPQIQAKREGQFSPTVSLMEQRLHKQFYAKVAALQAANVPDAVAKAEAFVRQNFEKEIANPQFFKDGDYALFKGTPTIPAAAAARGQWVESNIKRQGVDALDANGAIYTISELNKIEEDMQKPGYVWDPLAQNLAARFGISPLAVINRQRRAAGMEPIMPPSISKFATKADPNLVRQLEQYQTPEISTRAMGSTNTFMPELIKPYNGIDIGSLIQQAATKYNLPAPVLAGLLAHESAGFDPAVLSGQRRSSAGAIGIAQFMPGTAAEMGVDPLNVAQAIDGAARYLSQNMSHPNNPGNSLNWAISAYNSGPGAVGMSQENREYFGKVMKEAYKYGHGNQSLQSRSLLRPGFIQKTSNYDTGFGWQPVSMQDEKGRPVVMSRDAANAFAQMVQASGGAVRGSDIASSQRTKEKNIAVGGVPGSRHVHGEAIDIHGKSKKWMIENGQRYGWYLVDYQGSHGGHFEYRGVH
jgi:hypothetical protein